MGHKTLTKNIDGSYTFTDTRTVDEAHEENLSRIREIVTTRITDAGYDEIWQRNAALGVIDAAQVEAGRAFIANLRIAYHTYKTRLLASTRDEADSIPFNLP